MTTPSTAELARYGAGYITRWTTWLADHPDADPALVAALMGRGEPPPDTEPTADESAISAWADAYPAAHRVYWTLRAALEETDGGNRAHHHRVAILAIHDAFGSKIERARLRLPATALELATLLGVTDRALRKYRVTYRAVFETTRATVRESFIAGYYGRVFEALGETAATTGRDGAADRRLFVQLAGDLVERQDVTSGGDKVQVAIAYADSDNHAS